MFSGGMCINQKLRFEMRIKKAEPFLTRPLSPMVRTMVHINRRTGFISETSALLQPVQPNQVQEGAWWWVRGHNGGPRHHQHGQPGLGGVLVIVPALVAAQMPSCMVRHLHMLLDVPGWLPLGRWSSTGAAPNEDPGDSAQGSRSTI
jgi:hypothetical protein